MTNQTEIPDPDTHQQLEKIEIQRHALEQLFKVTRSVESLRIGLETTVLLGKPTGHTSEKAMNLYKLLDVKTHNLSNYDVHMRLKRIDKKLQKHLTETLYTVEHIEDQAFIDSVGDAIEITHNLIEDFKRSAQTMIALQVLLNIRGLPVTPKTFNLSQEVLQEKIGSIRTRERKCRQQISDDTLAMEKDIKVILYAENCSETMRPFLQHVLKGLKSNRRHIEQGLNIHELPYEIDQITITDCAAEVQFEEAPKPSIPELPLEQNTPTVSTAPEKSILRPEKPEALKKDEPPKKTAPTVPKKKKVGLLKGIGIWLNSPVSVSLKDIRKK